MPSNPDSLRVGGLTQLTSIDFPGRLAAVVFCQGCLWRCGYCHNPGLHEASQTNALPWQQVRSFLARRQNLLDGVVFSGGEPTLQAALPEALRDVRALGFQTALHSGGAYPQRLAAVLAQLDWVGLDIKGPSHRIDAITGARGSALRVHESLRQLLASGVAYECRTTWHPGLFGAEELTVLAGELAELGVKRWALQECRGPGVAAFALAEEQRQALAARFEQFELRRS